MWEPRLLYRSRQTTTKKGKSQFRHRRKANSVKLSWCLGNWLETGRGLGKSIAAWEGGRTPLPPSSSRARVPSSSSTAQTRNSLFSTQKCAGILRSSITSLVPAAAFSDIRFVCPDSNLRQLPPGKLSLLSLVVHIPSDCLKQQWTVSTECCRPPRAWVWAVLPPVVYVNPWCPWFLHVSTPAKLLLLHWMSYTSLTRVRIRTPRI